MKQFANQDFGWTLGLLAKHGHLYADVSRGKLEEFLRRYSAETGVSFLQVSQLPGVHLRTSRSSNKYGYSLSLRFPDRYTRLPRFSVPVKVSRNAIHDTDFCWQLIRMGFRLGSQAMVSRDENFIEGYAS